MISQTGPEDRIAASWREASTHFGSREMRIAVLADDFSIPANQEGGVVHQTAPSLKDPCHNANPIGLSEFPKGPAGESRKRLRNDRVILPGRDHRNSLPETMGFLA
jgi:hypothetical protein